MTIPPRLIHRLADGKQSDDENQHVDAVEQLRNAEGEARVAGELIDTDESERQPEEEAEQSPHQRTAKQRRHGGERQNRQREVLGRPEAKREAASGGAKKVSASVASVPATKEPMAAVVSAAAPRPCRAMA